MQATRHPLISGVYVARAFWTVVLWIIPLTGCVIAALGAYWATQPGR